MPINGSSYVSLTPRTRFLVGLSRSDYETKARVRQAHESVLKHRRSGSLDREPEQTASRPRRRAKLTSKQVDIIVRDYQAGVPVQQIADKLYIHRKTVHHNLKRRGVPPRGR